MGCHLNLKKNFLGQFPSCSHAPIIPHLLEPFTSQWVGNRPMVQMEGWMHTAFHLLHWFLLWVKTFEPFGVLYSASACRCAQVLGPSVVLLGMHLFNLSMALCSGSWAFSGPYFDCWIDLGCRGSPSPNQ